MKRITKTLVSVVLVLTAFAVFASAQGGKKTQAQLASKSVKFETVAKTDEAVKTAIDAHELEKAAEMVGESGAFTGTVAALFAPRTGTVLILNFDREYKTALTAVIRRADYDKFPDLSKLEGKKVLVTGIFTDFRGATQVELTTPDQIKIVE